MSRSSRRVFLIRAASTTAGLAGAGLLSACGGSDEPLRFDYGVASGDPLADRVILWTHAKYGDFDATSRDVELRYEVASDAAFTQLVTQGDAVARASSGHTVKVDATGLAPGRSYYYRFRSGSETSPVGQTRTLPAAGATDLRLAVFSCSNYPAGYFHAYTEALKAGAEYALHLGDYIYEYPAGGYASQDAGLLGRESRPATECLTLADYRTRYAQYRSDPDLKSLHARLPMIAVWDDHEIANDAWTGGADNHTDSTEGAFTARVAAALQAYHEWLPIRTPDPTDLKKIYRRFDFGGLVSLHMLETRLLGREKPVDVAELLNPATAGAALARLASPARQMLGATQQAWLSAQLASSTATWQVLGQQVLMARMEFPASVLAALNPSNTSAEAVAAGQRAITDYLTAKATAAQAPALLTDVQRALLDPALNPRLGYNLDAWDGYAAARETVLATAAALGKRLVVLAGDTHNAWHSELQLLDGRVVGQEFATPSVSSPGFEEVLPTLPPDQAAAIFRGVVDTLSFADTARRGFLLMRFTPAAVNGTWHFVSTVKAATYTVDASVTRSFTA